MSKLKVTFPTLKVNNLPMNFKIHRGTLEIGGSCVEIWTDTTKIVVDIGMPLVVSDEQGFNFKQYEKLATKELVQKGILPIAEENEETFYSKIPKKVGLKRKLVACGLDTMFFK